MNENNLTQSPRAGDCVCCRQHGGIKITARALWQGRDLQVMLFGGEAHIGSIALAGPESAARCLVRDGHRDYEVAAPMASALATALQCNVAVSAGIHYNAISRAEIELVLRLCAMLTHDLLGCLRHEHGGEYD